MTQIEAKRLIAVMMTIWKNYTPYDTNAEANMYVRYLGKYPYSEVLDAVDECAHTEKYAPSIARIEEVMNDRGERRANWQAYQVCSAPKIEMGPCPMPDSVAEKFEAMKRAWGIQ